ncbi:uncharacterized protein LOC129600813 isoform X2 [Paramacrobiotus metropolitanus]|uniref:uncharacterized protein LOC129600813 isoform X2 n=1 Tax=Paramacrobiotus metropolitanus TaxID=2943436 RepID=UPI002445B68A|nr:uncharacterized protein LOC129600813 isoform X2 [Paramacrobiotus metropolitanus]
MWNFITVFSILLWILFCLNGGQSLSCNRCDFGTNKYQCVKLTDDTVEVCPAQIRTCVVGTGVEKIRGKWSPIMNRRCSNTGNEFPHDPEAFDAVAVPNGEKIFCTKLQRKITGPDGQPLSDVRCICTEDKCNAMVWDDAMQLPTIPRRPSGKYTPADKPIREPLGNNSLANTEKIFTDNPPSGNISVNPGPGDPGSEDGKTPNSNSFSTTKAGNASNTDTSDAPAAESGNGKGGTGGSNTGLIAGVVAGLLALLAAAGGGLWWFLAQRKKKKKKKGSDDSGDSNDSEESGGSGGDE